MYLAPRHIEVILVRSFLVNFGHVNSVFCIFCISEAIFQNTCLYNNFVLIYLYAVALNFFTVPVLACEMCSLYIETGT